MTWLHRRNKARLKDIKKTTSWREREGGEDRRERYSLQTSPPVSQGLWTQHNGGAAFDLTFDCQQKLQGVPLCPHFQFGPPSRSSETSASKKGHYSLEWAKKSNIIHTLKLITYTMTNCASHLEREIHCLDCSACLLGLIWWPPFLFFKGLLQLASYLLSIKKAPERDMAIDCQCKQLLSTPAIDKH